MNEQAKVDVLGVMAAAVEQINNDVYPEDAEKARAELIEARAAVAELIEAAKQVEHIKGRQLGRGAVRIQHACWQRFRAALARIGGGK